MTVGFVALWKNNQREYVASPRDEWGTTDDIQAAFARGRERGNRTYGLYFCRWSGAWQYFTFWVSPSVAAVFDTIADLERAGDFKFADSWHLVGSFSGDAGSVTEGAWDIIPEPIEAEPAPFAAVLLERHSARSGRQPGSELSQVAGSCGVNLYGSFDCRFSTGWDRFTFMTGKDNEALTGFLSQAERQGRFVATDTLAVTGRLDAFFRFGNRLQTSLTWLNEEDAAP